MGRRMRIPGRRPVSASLALPVHPKHENKKSIFITTTTTTIIIIIIIHIKDETPSRKLDPVDSSLTEIGGNWIELESNRVATGPYHGQRKERKKTI